MIEILPERNKELLLPLYKENGLVLAKNDMAVIAKSGNEMVGYCLFSLDSERITVYSLEPQNDILMADGILRSALHVGVEHEIMTAYYSDSAPEELFIRLRFLGDEPKSLRVEKLFESCKGCNNKA